MPKGDDPKYKHPVDNSAIIDELFEKDSWEHDMSMKCQEKLAVYPVKTEAVLFYSQTGNGKLDMMSNHGGCPVLDGTKWAANLWVWNGKYLGYQDPAAQLTVTFRNAGAEQIKLYWEETMMMEMAPGAEQEYNTYTTHKWTFRDVSGNILEHVKLLDDTKLIEFGGSMKTDL